MKLEGIACDICGARQGAKDDWWKLTTKNGFYLFKNDVNFGERKDICSAMCATRALQEFICPEQKTVPEPNKNVGDMFPNLRRTPEEELSRKTILVGRIVETPQNGLIQCDRCNGKKVIDVEYFSETCPRCEGTGVEP